MSTAEAIDKDTALRIVRSQRDGYVRDLHRLKATRGGIDTAIRLKRSKLEVANELIRSLQK